MKRDRNDDIEQWFIQHSDDGEFFRPARSTPYAVVCPSGASRVMIYCTKPTAVVPLVNRGPSSEIIGIVGRNGLPHRTDISWIRKLVGSRNLLYLGDLDPVDLMIYVWLRTELPQGRMKYLGLCDSLLARMRMALSPAVTIPLSPSERSAAKRLQSIFPQLEDITGPECKQLIDSGYKVEVEALLVTGNKATRELRKAVFNHGGDP